MASNENAKEPPSRTSVIQRPAFTDHERVLRHTVFAAAQRSARLPECLQQVYIISTSARSKNLLKCPPSFMVRLMRHERDTIAVEAEILKHPLLSPSPPRLLHLELDQKGQGQGQGQDQSSCMLLNLNRSVPIVKLGQLADSESISTQRNIWLWVLSLSSLTHSGFGPVYLALRGHSSPTWEAAFSNMMTMVLLDAEDHLIQVPYQQIRQCVRQCISSLGAVTTPKLVLLDCLRRDNILVEPISLRVKGLVESWNAVWGDPELALCGLGSQYFTGVAQTLLPQMGEVGQQRRLL